MSASDDYGRTVSPSLLSRLPKELHSSAHQVILDNSLIGEYELRIHRGGRGPVIILVEPSSSPLPLEYLSEHAVTRFHDVCPNSRARFFEFHQLGPREVVVEVGREEGVFFRNPCRPEVLLQALGMTDAAGSDSRHGIVMLQSRNSTR